MSSRFATFFRNVNLGRPGSPTRTQLLRAFAAAGAGEPRSFLTHGNVVFTAPGEREAEAIAARAAARLRRACGLAEPGFTRGLAHLAALVASDPFVDAPADDVHQQTITFLPRAPRRRPTMPLVTPRRDAEVFRLDGGEAFGVIRKIGGRAGSPNALLERALGVPATTRNWRTVVRLVERFG
ncbi:MAG TPA: DUF1697 domain-containing protein [Gemmatimonadales bacterium]|nr:DUF1697 domain-containing protein [Gemmatimonadales bacterium]